MTVESTVEHNDQQDNSSLDQPVRVPGAAYRCLLALVVVCVSGCQDRHNSGGDGQSSTQNSKHPVVSSTGPWPRAVAPETDFNCGRMSLDGPDGKHDFAITNNGDAPLRLIAGKSTCQCTQFTLDRDEVGQGETATLTIQWQAKKETAAFRHGGIVYTNDPDQTEIKFDVEGIIEAPVMITPQHVWSAGNMTAATPGTIEASLFSRVFPKLTIDNVSAETDVTTVEYFPMTDQKLQENEALCGFTFRVTISPKLSIGELDDTLTISITELPDDIRVPVQATRLGDIRFSPMRGTKFNRRKRLIRLGAFHAANGHKAELMVLVDQDNFNEELKLLEVQSDPTSLKVSLEPIGKPGEVVARYRMTVAILPGGLRLQRTVENAGTIRCLTNHPGEKEIVIRVSFDAH